MIKINEFDDKLSELRKRHCEYDEHVLRLHLMGYSVFHHILETKLFWALLKGIEWGYQGLLRNELIERLLDEDPFNLSSLDESEYEGLKVLVRFQVDSFLRQPRDSKYEYEDFYHLLLELSFTDPEAVRRWEEDESWRELNENQSIVAHLEHYFHATFVDFTEGKLIVETQKFSLGSYQRYVDYLLSEFFQRSNFYPTKIATDVIVDRVAVAGSSTFYILDCGVGSVLLQMSRSFPAHEFISIDAKSRSVCESFLCELNLWSVADVLGESSVSQLNDPFSEAVDEFASNREHNTDHYSPDIAIGFVSPIDAISPKLIDRKFYKLSHGSENYENAYVELLLSTVSENGKVVVGVPERLLFSADGRVLRETCLSKDFFVSITRVTEEFTDKSLGPVSIISLDLDKKEIQRGRVSFISGVDSIEKTIDSIRQDNPDLDLRPSRFLDSIEYEYRNIFDLFETGILDPKLRPSLIEILEALNSKRRYDTLFNPSRILLEAVYYSLFSSELHVKREVFFDTDDRISLEKCWRYFSGMPVQRFDNDRHPLKRSTALFPPNIKASAKACQALTNPNSHYYRGASTLLAFKSAAFALLDLLEWYKTVMRK